MRAFLQTCCLHRFTYFIVAFHFEVLLSNARAMHGQRRPQIPILNALAKDNKVRGCHFHRKTTVFWVFYSELVDRAASHAACMAFEGFWFTSPFTLPARLPTQASCHLTRRLVWKFSFVSSRFRHEWTIKSALCEPESSCHFRDFRFVLSIPFGGRVPSTMWDLCGKPSHLGVGSGLPRPFGLLKF